MTSHVAKYAPLALALAVLAAGCGGSEVEPDAPVTLASGQTAPAWFLNPQIDADGLYAAGVSDEVRSMSLGLRNAEADARVRLASIFESKVQSVFKRYLRSVRGGGAGPEEEQLIQEASRVIVDTKLHGARIVKQENPAQGVWYVLLQVPFDDISKEVKKVSKERIKEVENNAEQAFAELDRLLKDELQE